MFKRRLWVSVSFISFMIIFFGHLPGHTSLDPSPVQTVEWMVKTTSKDNPTATVKVVSEKGGTQTKELKLTE